MKVVCLMLLSMFLFGCERIDENVLEHIIIKDNNIKIYSETYLYDLFDFKDIELKTENKLLNTKHIGKKTYTIEYVYDKKIYEYDLIYNIVDTEAPRYFGGTNKTISKNYEGDYMMWQLSNTGKIDGIYGDVDINVMYK